MTIDPRLATIDKRLAGVRRILAVTGGKGGIGKSLVSSLLALSLAERGLRAGLLDLDLTGPNDHVLLGVGARFPAEAFGIEPVPAGPIGFMSLACFAHDAAIPLRGQAVTDALLELLAITRWSERDVLVVDMPPGLGDAALDMIRVLRRAEYLVLATPSRVVLETVRRNLELLAGVGATVTGVIENMRRDGSSAVAALAMAQGVPYLGALPYDESVEQATGDPARLGATRLAAALGCCLDALAPAPAGSAA